MSSSEASSSTAVGTTFHTAASHPVAQAGAGSSSHAIVRYGSSGVHTVEGNVAGARAARLTKAREQEQTTFEAQKRQIEVEQRSSKVDDRFVTYSDAYEAEFKRRTVGLVTAAEFRDRRHTVQQKEEKRAQQDPAAAARQHIAKKKKKKRAKSIGLLSFDADADADVDAGSQASGAAAAAAPRLKKARIGTSIKDPTVDTSFLPDRERERREAEEREALKAQWRVAQEKTKAEVVEVTYSYWDGSGHRRVIEVQKGTSIGKFLEQVRQNLAVEFPELRGVSSDNLLYIKEDLIVPHHFSFYDLIVTKARGKSGPLFHFDVHDDVRVVNDARVEKDESHPGKICERSWYERNKHIFPASRWEVYDPAVQRDKYTVHGGEIMSKS